MVFGLSPSPSSPVTDFASSMRKSCALALEANATAARRRIAPRIKAMSLSPLSVSKERRRGVWLAIAPRLTTRVRGAVARISIAGIAVALVTVVRIAVARITVARIAVAGIAVALATVVRVAVARIAIAVAWGVAVALWRRTEAEEAPEVEQRAAPAVIGIARPVGVAARHQLVLRFRDPT